ncbi:GroES-like protein [Violaceomyces palustris]|uniref:GroES-like protein n=1 Tax=Violaceomyces palustris TaxID=1673888 RepID=A0ACD0NWS3_9BASI|nr:GroES-like protein [Violaceomyces palustris]
MSEGANPTSKEELGGLEDSKFFGWICESKDCLGKMVWSRFKPKEWRETDVDIKVECCGICMSDLSTATSGWGPTRYPICVGHEIVGKVVRVGKEVKNVSLGQRVGVGAQSGSCLACEECKKLNEPYCVKGQIGTYNGKYKDGSGLSQGGYSNYCRVPAHFAIPIPDSLESVVAAPMMCGGITVYSPLKENGCGTPGFERVGIVGIGGLGHFGLIFAKALGAKRILAVSHSNSKESLARELGATDFLATANSKGGEDGFKKHARSLDLLVVTNNNADMPIHKYLGLVRPKGKVIHVGLPEDPVMPTPIGKLLATGAFLGGSMIGGTKLIREMLELTAEQKLRPLVEVRSMADANQTVLDMHAGKPRFRYVLVNQDHDLHQQRGGPKL